MVIGVKKKQAGLYWHLASVTLLDSSAIHSPSEHGGMNHWITPVRPVSGLASSANALTPHRLCQHWQYGVRQTVCISQYTHSANMTPFSHYSDKDIWMTVKSLQTDFACEPLMAYVSVFMHVNCWKTNTWSKRLQCRWDKYIEWISQFNLFFYITHIHSTYRTRIRSLQAMSRLFLFTDPKSRSFFDYIRST